MTLPAPERTIAKIPFPFRRQIVHALVRLKANPRPWNSQPIELDVYRLVLHDWRVVYVVDDEQLTVTVVRVVSTTA